MPVLYDQDISYDTSLTYDGILAYKKINRTLFAVRYADSMMSLICYDASGVPVDLTGKTLSGKILEFWDSAKEIPCVITVTDPFLGQYSIEIDDSVSTFRRNQYVYYINIMDGTQVNRVAFGNIVVI